MEANTQWLAEPVATWMDNDNYVHLKEFCRDIQVVNDAAERAVKDVAEYAQMTRDPKHRDNVILVANDHRGKIPHLKKANLNNV